MKCRICNEGDLVFNMRNNIYCDNCEAMWVDYEVVTDLRKRLLVAGADSCVPLTPQGDGSYKHLCSICDKIHWKGEECND